MHILFQFMKQKILYICYYLKDIYLEIAACLRNYAIPSIIFSFE